ILALWHLVIWALIGSLNATVTKCPSVKILVRPPRFRWSREAFERVVVIRVVLAGVVEVVAGRLMAVRAVLRRFPRVLRFGGRGLRADGDRGRTEHQAEHLTHTFILA